MNTDSAIFHHADSLLNQNTSLFEFLTQQYSHTELILCIFIALAFLFLIIIFLLTLTQLYSIRRILSGSRDLSNCRVALRRMREKYEAAEEEKNQIKSQCDDLNAINTRLRCALNAYHAQTSDNPPMPPHVQETPHD